MAAILKRIGASAYVVKLVYEPSDPRRDPAFEARYHHLYDKLLKLEAGDLQAMSVEEVEEHARMEHAICQGSIAKDDPTQNKIIQSIEEQRKALLKKLSVLAG